MRLAASTGIFGECSLVCAFVFMLYTVAAVGVLLYTTDVCFTTIAAWALCSGVWYNGAC